MLTNINRIKLNQTLKRGQLSHVKWKLPKVRKTHNGGHKHDNYKST